MCSKADDPAYLSMQEADMSAPLNRDGVEERDLMEASGGEPERYLAMEAEMEAEARKSLPEPAATIVRLTEKLREDLAFAAPEIWPLHIERRLAQAYEAGEAADPDAARAVVALLGGEAGTGLVNAVGPTEALAEARRRIADIPNDADNPDGEQAVSEYRDKVLRALREKP